MELQYLVNSDNKYKTINEVIDNYFKISNRLKLKINRLKKVYLNKKNVDTRSSISYGDIITIDFNYEEETDNVLPTKMNLDILYEDDWLIAVNKPSNCPIHPSRAHYLDSLSNGISYYFKKIGLKKKIRPINRLDIGTSGIVLFAKCEYIQESLINQMKINNFTKEYICLVEGFFSKKEGVIDFPISRKEGSIIERKVSKTGKMAKTYYKILQEFDNSSLVKCTLETGRTHQIRVHMSYINHPIIGDTLYGSKSDLIDRQALHSSMIKFIHPITKKEIIITSSIPYDIKKLIS